MYSVPGTQDTSHCLVQIFRPETGDHRFRHFSQDLLLALCHFPGDNAALSDITYRYSAIQTVPVRHRCHRHDSLVNLQRHYIIFDILLRQFLSPGNIRCRHIYLFFLVFRKRPLLCLKHYGKYRSGSNKGCQNAAVPYSVFCRFIPFIRLL